MWTGFCACSDSEKTSTSHHHPHHHHLVYWPHHLCVPIRVSRLRGWCVIISLPVPWVCLLCQHTSMPEVCQHARGSSLKCLLPWTFPGGSRSPRCPEGQDVVPLCQMAQNPQDCTYGIVYSWNDDFCVVLLLSCDGLVGCVYHHNCFKVL